MDEFGENHCDIGPSMFAGLSFTLQLFLAATPGARAVVFRHARIGELPNTGVASDVVSIEQATL
jgi:hypothetical protein